jgi:dTDP-4-dehydrorhamnose reductase
MQNILVTGANGQVGNELKTLSLKYPDYNFFFTDVQDLDITNAASIHQFFTQNKITACFNCAAYTAVDKAESEVELAQLVNAKAVEYLAKACEANHAVLLHLSTDYVYHNNQNTPFQETDPTNPQSIYGSSKLKGDEYALQFCSRAMVIRTSWVYSSHGHNFVKTMLRLGADRDQLTVIFDQIGSPTYAADLAAAMLHCFRQIEEGTIENWQGIYHYSNEGVCSWYDFALAIFELSKIQCKVLPIETKDYPTPAKRPHFSLLNKAKIKSCFNMEIPHWRDSLKGCLELLT